MGQDLKLVDHFGLVEACPGCGERNFLVAAHDDAVAFECLGCESLWRHELGYVWRVRASSRAARSGSMSGTVSDQRPTQLYAQNAGELGLPERVVCYGDL